MTRRRSGTWNRHRVNLVGGARSKNLGPLVAPRRRFLATAMPIGFIGGLERLKYYFVLLPSLTALVSTGAWARDIRCATTRQPAELVICDHAILNNEYDNVFAQQQALLNSGKLSPEQLAHWRQSRNACNDVHCIDTVFAQ
jgi:hypothetical protein